jgi:putative acetyltransferase
MGQLELVAEMRAIHELVVIASVNAVPFYEEKGYSRVAAHEHEYHGEPLTLVEMERRPLRG